MKNKKILLRNKKKKGFTLVELMAVMAIMLILSVAFLPKISGYIKEAKKAVALSQAKKVVTVFETLKLKNSSISESSKASDLVGINNDLLSNEDIDKLDTSITVQDCINMLDSENSSFELNDDGKVSSITPQS